MYMLYDIKTPNIKSPNHIVKVKKKKLTKILMLELQF